MLNLARNQYARLTRTAALASLRASPYEPQHARPVPLLPVAGVQTCTSRAAFDTANRIDDLSQEGLRMLNLVDSPAHVMKKKA